MGTYNEFGPAPGHCSSLSGVVDTEHKTLNLTYTDPVYGNGGSFGGTHIVIKIGDKPITETDGVVYTEYIHNAHQTTALTHLLADDYGKYYVSLFPFSVEGSVNRMQVCTFEFNYEAPIKLDDLTWDQIKQRCDDNDMNSFVIGDIRTFTLKNELYETDHQVRLIDKCTTGEKPYKLLFESLNLIPDPDKKITVTAAKVYFDFGSPYSIYAMFSSKIFTDLFPADLINVLSLWGGKSADNKFGLLTKEQYDKYEGVLYYRAASEEEWKNKMINSVSTPTCLKNTYSFYTHPTTGSVTYAYFNGTDWKSGSTGTVTTSTYCFKI